MNLFRSESAADANLIDQIVNKKSCSKALQFNNNSIEEKELLENGNSSPGKLV